MKLPYGNEQLIRLHLLSARDLINRAKEISKELPAEDVVFLEDLPSNRRAAKNEYLDQASSQLNLAEIYLS